MTRTNADRNLLFGILALQLDFIGREDLIGAMNAWVLDKSKPLGRILLEQGKLEQARLRMLETLVSEHLKQHGGDTEKSLAAIGGVSSVREHLEQLGDSDVEASLERFSVAQSTRQGREATPVSADPHSTLPVTVGTSTSAGMRFQILRPHARGGLGVISVALDQELNREVALKEILEEHGDDQERRVRFMLEAQVTGGLEHPGIVPVYGMGQYADGRPYYAMRFVRGDSLKEAIERFHQRDAVPERDGGWHNAGERSLELRKLLGRFNDVCDAIEYAHSRGVLHRDLKPANIMLGKYGETLVVDWGLAKPVGRPETHRGSAEATLLPPSSSGSTPTQTGAAVGTPAYMSSEQAAGRLDELGPASDVYSLGATLYTLLTGQAPFGQSDDLGSTLRKVQNGDFTRPRTVKPDLSPALEAICLKAMSREPHSRYASPREFAEDIEHWLANEPVSAYPEPFVARVRRWIHAHETLVGCAAAAVLMAGVCLSVFGAVVSERNRKLEVAYRNLDESSRQTAAARDEAEREKRRAEASRDDAEREKARAEIAAVQAEAVSDFLQGMFQANDPVGMKGWRFGQTATSRQNLTAREILEQGEAKVREELKDQPIVQAALMNAIGECYLNLAILDKAAPLLEQSLDLRRKTLGSDHPDVAESLLNIGVLRHELGDYEAAEKAYREALELRRRHFGEDDVLVSDAMFQLAWLLADTGGFDESERLFRRVIELRRTHFGKEHRQVAAALVGLAGLFIQRGDDELNVMAIVQQAQRILARQKGYEALADAIVQFQTGLIQDRMFGSLDAAEQHLRKAREQAIHALGDGHPYVAFATFELAEVLRRKKQYDEAEQLQREILATVRVLAPDHPRMTIARDGLAYTLELKGDLQVAKEQYAESLRLQENWLASHQPTLVSQIHVGDTHGSLAGICRRMGDVREAESHSLRYVDIATSLLESHPSDPYARLNMARALSVLGDANLAMHEPDKALANYQRCREIVASVADTKPKDRAVQDTLAQSYSDLAHVCRQLGQFAAALDYCRNELIRNTDETRPKPAA